MKTPQTSSLSLLLLLSLLIQLIVSCSSDPYADCAYGQPSPIFSAEITDVQSHDFKLDALKGMETVTFSDNTTLNLTQSGCDLIKQDFLFSLNPAKVLDNDNFWIKSTIERFNFMGRLSPDLASFAGWAAAIQGVARDLKIGKQVMVQPGYSVTIDKMVSDQEVILKVTLQEHNQE